MSKREIRMVIPQIIHEDWMNRAASIGVPLTSFVLMSMHIHLSSSNPPEPEWDADDVYADGGDK